MVRSPPQSTAVERRHHVLGEPTQLLLEFVRRQPLGPMDHEILEPRVFRLDRLDAVDDVCRRAAEPRFLLYPIGQRRDARRRAGSAPGAALLVGVADKPEWCEPFVALVMRWLDPAHRLCLRVGEIETGTPDHVFAELFRSAVAGAGGVIGAHDIVEDLFAVQCDYRLQALFGYQVDGLAAGDRHPDIDRQVLGTRYHRDFFELVAAIGDRRRAFEIFAFVMKGSLVETFQQEIEALLEYRPVGLGIEQRRAKGLHFPGVVAAADTHYYPAVGYDVSHRIIFGEPDRMPHR